MKASRRQRLLATSLVAALVAAAMLAAGCGSSTNEDSGSSAAGGTGSTANSAATSGKRYKIYLSNSFIGNSFRVLMEKSTVVAAQHPPLVDRVDLKIANTDATVTAQINSLNQIIQQKPDAILLDAASETALNPVVERACAAGIVVVTFDEAATAPCAWKVSVDVDLIGRAWANWFVKSLGGRGEIFQDLGLPGHGLSKKFNSYLDAELKKNPDLKVVCTFQSQYALGPEQEGVSKCLGAHPNVDGVWALGYAGGAMKALQEAGHRQVPVTGGGYNVGGVNCAQMRGECLLASYPPSIGPVALRTAVDILDGDRDLPKDQTTAFPFFQQGGADTTVPGEEVVPLKEGENYFPDLDGGLVIPWQIPGLPDVTLEEINRAEI